MTYKRIRQPKLSDVIEQELERLILEGILSPGEQLPPERELAKQFDVSRPSVREAMLRLESKQLLHRRQGGGTFVSDALWRNFSDPLLELISSDPETQWDVLESRHALEGLIAYFAALRGTDADFSRILAAHGQIQDAQKAGDLEAEVKYVLAYLLVVTETAHNVVLLHIMRSLMPLLEQNILQNFQLLNREPEVVAKVRQHRAETVEAIVAKAPELARSASYAHLAYLEETLLSLTREDSRRQRALRRGRQRKERLD